MKQTLKAKHNYRKNQRHILPILLVLCIMTGLCGCSRADNPFGTADNAKQSMIVGKADEHGNMSDPQNVAMGRYMETVVDLKESGIVGYKTNLSVMPDNSLLVMDCRAPAVRSEDGGDTWEVQSYDWLKDLLDKTAYILSYTVAPNGTAAVIYDRSPETHKKSNFDEEWDPGLVLITPDGTRTIVDVPLSEDESYPYDVWASPDNRIFASALGGSNLYEIKPDGSCKKYLSLPGLWPDLVQFCGSLMILGGNGYNGLLLYDMEKEEYVKDDVLNDFVINTFGDDGLHAGTDTFTYYFFPGEESNILYLAGRKGLYRHVIGGSAIEQIIDGSLCSFGNPTYELAGALMLPDNQFAALFSGGRFVRYTYDPTVPTVPAVRLKVYSLKDNSLLRMASSNYQIENPDVYVEYEIGMEQDTITKDDALKKLNTQIMAGEGPDLLLLDDMPLNAYIEKGLLADLSSFADSLSGEDALFPNIVDAFRKDGHIYALPCSIEIPAITCRKKYMPMLTDLSGIADAAELMREDFPDYDLAGTTAEKGIMKLFAPVCAPSWITAQNTIDREKLSDFLTQTKRIYNAQMNGIRNDYIKYYDELNQSFVAAYGYSREDYDQFSVGMNQMAFILYDRGFLAGSISNLFYYAESISLPRTDGYSDFETLPLTGQCDHVFKANSLVGISAASPYPDRAEELLKVLLGKDSGDIGEILPVNQAAFEKVLTPNPETVKSYDTPYMYYASSDAYGRYAEFASYWPNDADQEILRNYVKEATVPYIRNKELEEAVYRHGIYFMHGKKSLDSALNDIEKEVSLQMAE